MERSQLIYVVTVAECGSVTRAAEKLHLSQPSLSNQIIHLEQELGIALFARVRKRVHLTEAGEVFVRHAQRILNDMQALAERMEDYAANRSGRVRIGALPIMCALHIPELIGGFHSEYPSITLTLQERGSAELLQALEQSEIDVAFAILNPSEPAVRHMCCRSCGQSPGLPRRDRTGAAGGPDVDHAQSGLQPVWDNPVPFVQPGDFLPGTEYLQPDRLLFGAGK